MELFQTSIYMNALLILENFNGDVAFWIGFYIIQQRVKTYDGTIGVVI